MVDIWQMAGIETTVLISACGFFLFIYFFNRLIQIRKKSREYLPFLGLIFIPLFFGLAYFAVSWFDYMRWEYNETVFVLFKIYSILYNGSFVAFAFLCEVVFKKTKFITTFLGIAIIVAITISPSMDLLLSSVLSAPFVLFLFILVYIVFLRPLSGLYKQRIVMVISGFAGVVLGTNLRNDLFSNLTGLYVIGSILIILGCLIVGYGLNVFTTFTDLKWKEKLREMLVITDHGICLYAYSFEKKVALEDTDLVAGGLSGINTLLAEIIKTDERLQLFEYQNLKVLIEKGKGVMFILIIKERSTFIPHKLELFANEFQIFFKEILEKWHGETSVFSPTKFLVQRIFEESI